MKTQELPDRQLRRNRFEADLAARLGALFLRWPTLCGFSVREHFVTDVSVYPLSGLRAPEELCLEIVAALTELVEDCPEASEFIQERAFARVFH